MSLEPQLDTKIRSTAFLIPYLYIVLPTTFLVLMLYLGRHQISEWFHIRRGERVLQSEKVLV